MILVKEIQSLLLWNTRCEGIRFVSSFSTRSPLILFLYFSCLRNESLDEDFQATRATSSL